MIKQMARALQALMINKANEIGRSSGMIIRKRNFDGAAFFQMMIFSELGQAWSSLAELCQAAVQSGVQVSRQAVNKRFTPVAAKFMQMMVAETVQMIIQTTPATREALSACSQVVLCDSTTIDLPDELAEEWVGCGGNEQDISAALKVNVQWDWQSGQVMDVILQDGKAHDRSTVDQMQKPQAGALLIRDTGYFKIDEFASLLADDVSVLTRYKAGTVVMDTEGKRLDLTTWLPEQALSVDQSIEIPVLVGAQAQLPMRLIVQRVPQAVVQQRQARLEEEARRRQEPIRQTSYALAEWTIVLTTAPAALLTAWAALIFLHVRWQIELIFKLWKDQFKIDEWHTTNPWRILCEVHARLIAALLSQWLMSVEQHSNARYSTARAVQTIRKKAWHIGAVLTDWPALCSALTSLFHCLAHVPPMHRSRQKPRLFQLFEALKQAGAFP